MDQHQIELISKALVLIQEKLNALGGEDCLDDNILINLSQWLLNPRLKDGARVIHEQYGEGNVLSIDINMSIPVEVQFDELDFEISEYICDLKVIG